MDTIFLLAGLCLSVLAGLGGVSYLQTRGRLARLLKRVEQTELVSMARAGEGAAAAQGQAEALATVRSPLTEREVIAYRIRVADNSDDAPVTLVDTSEAADFLLVDATGKALVRPGEPLLLLGNDTSRTTGQLDRAPAALRALLAKHGHSTRGWILERSLAWTESVVEAGDTVYVLGEAHREVTLDEEPDNYREAPSRLVLQPAAGQRMIIADRYRDRVIELLRSYKTLPGEWIKR